MAESLFISISSFRRVDSRDVGIRFHRFTRPFCNVDDIDYAVSQPIVRSTVEQMTACRPNRINSPRTKLGADLKIWTTQNEAIHL